ncbi:MAG: Fe-S metabolism protein SufE [Bacteroidetes bacterium GWF2_38_335]|nr:MAG: Fe-S metabolism protein SufE [Bacteroidetes bacterium GWF2_38_335]OFY77982.1 MAG: Fe-S metabolism protein SufE [Bacteroidetes bacterium RIFOXYA12_FULL_38_20]HBS86705.1 Fe-S metabolism protein SufE [Bacteroidales bacterium]
MNIEEKQIEIIEEFSAFDDWMDKYEYLIDLGKELPAIAPELKTEENLIEGCQSKVWVDAELKDGKVYFTADSDAIITKGIISLLIKVLSSQPPKDIYEADLFFVKQIGLDQHLSPTRSNGLLSMIKQMKMYALAYQTKMNG